jgi:histone deacetylase 6
VETDGVSTTNIHLTNSYLVRRALLLLSALTRQLDTSDKIVGWVKSSEYSFIDVNVLAQLPTKAMTASVAKPSIVKGPR